MKTSDRNQRSTPDFLKIQRDLGVALNATCSLPEALRLLLEGFFQSGEADAAGLFIHGDSGNEIALESCKGFSQSIVDILRKSFFSDESVQFSKISNPLYTHFEKMDTPLGRIGITEGYRAIGIIPFIYLDVTLGTIVVSSRTNDHFSMDFRYTMETISTRIAGIINRIRGEETLKRINNTLEDLNTRMKASEERYRMVVEDQTDLISRFRPDGIITFVNGSYCRYFNKSKDDLVGHSFIPTIHSEDRERTQLHIRSLGIDRPVGTVEHRVILPDGSIRWIDWTDRAILDDEGNIVEYQSVGRDVTDRKTLEERLQFMSMHDALTKLYNRAFFDEQMKRFSDSRNIPVGVIVTDLNALKIVNDALGHQTGDLLLLTAASVLRSCFRGSDILARIGGDEFAIILPNTQYESLLQTIERIKKAIHDRRQNNPDIPLSLAIGYSVRLKKGTTMEEVFAEADDMMYREKENQREFTRGLVLTSLIREIERIEPYRAKHMLRVRDYAVALGTEAKLPAQEIVKLQLAARYHDIGMIGIDRTHLTESEGLTIEAEESIRHHVDIGARIAEAHPFLHEIAQVIQHHHEKWNGNGYPSGMAGVEIPELSRIITICDAFDAMTTHDTYKKTKSRDDALTEIDRLSGIQFDPTFVPLFTGLIKRGAVGI
jgi:diguanylate cyclase (GGDEF)-like protein/PAS domain S-box-containing protein